MYVKKIYGEIEKVLPFPQKPPKAPLGAIRYSTGYIMKDSLPFSHRVIKSGTISNQDDKNILERILNNLSDSYIAGLLANPLYPEDLKPQMAATLRKKLYQFSSDLSGCVSNAIEANNTAEQIIAETSPIMNSYTKSLRNALLDYDRRIQSEYACRDLANLGYTQFLILSEFMDSTCSRCLTLDGNSFTVDEVCGASLIPPLHPNCKCSLLALDKAAQANYNEDKAAFLRLLENFSGREKGGIFVLNPDYLENGAAPWSVEISPEPVSTQWAEKFKDWGISLLQDAVELFKITLMEARRRNVLMLNDPLSFLDVLLQNTVGTGLEAPIRRIFRAIEEPSFFNVVNVLTVGTADLLRGAWQPEEPLSLEHLLCLAGVFSLLYSAYSAASKALGSGAADELVAGNRRSKEYAVDPSMQAKDIEMGVLVDGVYIKNTTAQNISDLIKPGSNYVGSSKMNGQFMYVVDTDGNIIIGSRAGQHMPHSTLIGGSNPTVKGAGIIDVRGGKIYCVNNASGHFKPDNISLINIQYAFEQLPSTVFHKDFKGYLPFNEQGGEI